MIKLKQHLIEYKELNPSHKKFRDLVLIEQLTNLYPDCTPFEAAAIIVSGIDKYPVCPECGSKTEFIHSKKETSIYGGWKEFCSAKCSKSSPLLVQRRKQTNIEKYGVDSYAKTNESKEHSSEKWSDEKKLQFREKSKQTNLEKRGVEHHSQTQEYLDKRIATSIEKYGVPNTFQLLDKVREGHIKSFGMHYSQTNIAREKNSSNNGMKRPEIVLKSYLKRTERFYAHNLELRNAILSCDSDILHKYLLEQNIDNRIELSSAIGISSSFLNALLRKYNLRDKFLAKGKNNSAPEKEVREFVKSIYDGLIIKSDRTLIKPKEIDILIPEFKLGIEYNDIYYHSEGANNKDSEYHIGKTIKAEEQGYQILHIFSTEWQDKIKQEIWKSIIRNKLHVIEKKIYARQCILKGISSKESREFLELNHLSGFVGAKHHLGLFHNNQLVSVLSYGQSRFKTNEIEIIRFASLINTIVVGGLGKFMKVLPQNIVTYADRRISSILSSGYSKFFNTIETTNPSWWGFDRSYELKHRLSFQKHKLKELLPNYDDELSAFDNMLLNKYDRIWDCGNLKFSNY